MKLGDWLVVAITVQYAAAAIAYGFTRSWPSVIVFAGYALANVGFILMAVGVSNGVR